MNRDITIRVNPSNRTDFIVECVGNSLVVFGLFACVWLYAVAFTPVN